MPIIVTGRVCDPGSANSPNEDVVGATASSAWVIDGATGLGDEPLLPAASDAAWLASAYHAWLCANADRSDYALPDLFTEAITHVATEFQSHARRPPANRFELPSAGIAFVRLREANFEYTRLGDCTLIVGSRGNGRVVSTGRSPLRRLDSTIIERMKALRRDDPSMNYGQVRTAIKEELRANRNLLNTEAGYWVLSIDPSAACRLETGAVPLDRHGPATGLLVSDGFYRLVDTFHLYPDDAALLRATREHGLKALLSELRGMEDADPECTAHPRLKPKDDATALLLEIAY